MPSFHEKAVWMSSTATAFGRSFIYKYKVMERMSGSCEKFPTAGAILRQPSLHDMVVVQNCPF